MTTKEKIVFGLYIVTSVAIVANATVEIVRLAKESRQMKEAMDKRIEEKPLSI